MRTGGRWSSSVRLAASLLLLGLAAALLVPAAPPARRSAWEDLIAPFAVGLPVTRGYVLSPPRRGEAHDVIYIARRDAGPAGPVGRVEVRILDRGQWSGIAETRSFGIGWEVAPAGSMVPSPADDAHAITEALANAIAHHDTGFASVDSVALANEHDAPPIARILDRLTGVRGALIGASVAVALLLIASMPHGAMAAGCLLFALGLALRAPSLDVPFTHDQDVQRLFTGHLPLSEIATGAGLRDRHPPLYFFVLHFVERFGQSEAVVRAPAVLSGALAGPALLLATASMCGAIGPTAVLAALAVTISPELVARSREVSEIPLFALIVLVAAASLVAAVREARTGRLVLVALSHALALFTYYLAPAIIAAHAAVLAWLPRSNRRVVGAFAVGVIAGAPAFVLGLVTLFRDWSAREVARAFPALAWGEHTPAQMAAQMGRIALGALGLPLVALVLIAVAFGMVRRNLEVMTPALGAAATFAAIALLSPIARVQGYYVTTVLPLAALALAAAPEPSRLGYRVAWVASLVLAIALSTVPLLAGARVLYLPDGDAFMPGFASIIAQRPEQTIVTVAHYDKTLLAYYLARADGRSIDWASVDAPRAKRIEPLLMVHALDPEFEPAAARRLDEIIAAGPTLVVQRDAFLVPSLVQRLSACERLVEAPAAQLFRCAQPGRSGHSLDVF